MSSILWQCGICCIIDGILLFNGVKKQTANACLFLYHSTFFCNNHNSIFQYTTVPKTIMWYGKLLQNRAWGFSVKFWVARLVICDNIFLFFVWTSQQFGTPSLWVLFFSFSSSFFLTNTHLIPSLICICITFYQDSDQALLCSRGIRHFYDMHRTCTDHERSSWYREAPWIWKDFTILSCGYENHHPLSPFPRANHVLTTSAYHHCASHQVFYPCCSIDPKELKKNSFPNQLCLYTLVNNRSKPLFCYDTRPIPQVAGHIWWK